MKIISRFGLRAALALALAGLSSATVHAQNLVANPGFESGSTDWVFDGIAHLSDGANARTGSFETQFSGFESMNGSVSQSILTTIGQQYLVSFWATSDGFGSSPDFDNSLDASFGTATDDLSDSQLGVFDGTSRAPYSRFTFEFTAASPLTPLSFTGEDAYGNIWLDDISVVAVPEPGSIVLFGIAALGLIGLARRRALRRMPAIDPR